MSDQAQSLRQLVSSQDDILTTRPKAERGAKVITVSSGKGGVGKSNFTLNFALALKALGKKVLLFDADIGMANIDVLMGVRSQYSLYHLLKGEKDITEIISIGTGSLPYIAGGSGMADLFTLSSNDLNLFMTQLEKITADMDFIIFDTGAGLSKEVLNFITAADECIIVTTPEPTSITDAYALIKVIQSMEEQVSFRLMINRVSDEQEAKQVSNKIALVASKFLNIQIPMIGYMSDDQHVVRAVKKQVPFSVAFPTCNAAKDVERMAMKYMNVPQLQSKDTFSGIKGFMHKWLKRTK